MKNKIIILVSLLFVILTFVILDPFSKVKNEADLLNTLLKNPVFGKNLTIQEDKQNQGKIYVTSVVNSQNKVDSVEAVKVISLFAKNIKLKKMEGIEAIALIVNHPQGSSRLVLGKNIIDQESWFFWKKNNDKEIVSWLEHKCKNLHQKQLADSCEYNW